MAPVTHGERSHPVLWSCNPKSRLAHGAGAISGASGHACYPSCIRRWLGGKTFSSSSGGQKDTVHQELLSWQRWQASHLNTSPHSKRITFAPHVETQDEGLSLSATNFSHGRSNKQSQRLSSSYIPRAHILIMHRRIASRLCIRRHDFDEAQMYLRHTVGEQQVLWACIGLSIRLSSMCKIIWCEMRRRNRVWRR